MASPRRDRGEPAVVPARLRRRVRRVARAELADDLQPWRDELDAGVRVVISSDSDVASYRPLTTIAHAMLRRTMAGRVLGERHRLTLDEALFAHTIDAAFAVGLGAADRLAGARQGGRPDLAGRRSADGAT